MSNSADIPLSLFSNRVTVSEVTNSIVTSGTKISEDDFEKLICYNLSQNTLPNDLSANIQLVLPGNSSLSVADAKAKYGGIMLTNNDELIDSETFAMKISYVSNPTNTNNVVETYSLHGGFNQNITLVASGTNSYIDSHLRFDISYNNDLQKSVVQNTNTEGNWKMFIDRSDNSINNNYFAAINSSLNNTDKISPMKIDRLQDNPLLFEDGKYIYDIDPNTNEATYRNFSSSYTFAYNNLEATIEPTHDYTEQDFTMYKLVQDVPTVTQNIINGNASDLPICDANNNDISTPSLSQFENNVMNVIGNNIDKLKDGYNINVVIGEDSSGGFVLRDGNNDILSIDSSSLQNSVDFLNAGISSNTPMYVDITNGSVSLQKTDNSYNVYADYNINSLGLSNGEETLVYPFNTKNGLIQIDVPEVTNRTNILNKSNEWDSGVKIIYNCDEAYSYNVHSHIDVSMTINPVVKYSADIVVPTSTGDSYSYVSNPLNLKKSNDAALIISGNTVTHNPNMANYNNIVFNSNIHQLYPDNNTIAYVTIENKNILAEDTKLLNDMNQPIPNSVSTVKIQNMDLSESIYSDFQVRLNTKTVSELANSAAPTNGWEIQSTNGSNLLHTSSVKNSILYDDCLFMRSSQSTTFNYTFTIANPCVSNAQSIKHRVDISFNDVSVDLFGCVVSIPNHVYLDDDDITYIDVSYSNTSSSVFTDYTVSNNNYGLNVNNTKVRRIRNIVTYRVSFDPKFPFYTNIKLTSPVITEYIDSYKLYDLNDVMLPDVYLKYLVKTNTTIPLSHVSVSQSDSQPKTDLYKTSLTVSPSNCSTLTAILQGKNVNGDFVNIPNIPSQDQDPYFNTLTEFVGVDGYTARVSVVVQVTYPTVLSSPYYIIDTVNAPGTNVSFTTKLYKYDMTNKDGTNNAFDNFNAYQSAWISNRIPSLEIQLDNQVVLDNNNNVSLIIYGENKTSVLATIDQPNTIIDDFNIVYCYNPLVRVVTNVLDLSGNYVMNNVHSYSDAVLVSNNSREVFIDDGVYAYTNANPPRLSSIEFSLKSDSVSVEFVSDSNYNNFNNGWNNFTPLNNVSGNNSFISLHNGNLVIELKSGNSNGLNTTKSISFNKYRGHKRVSGGVDTINILRSSSTATFTFEGTNGTYQQIFNDFAKNGVYTIDNAVKVSDSASSVDIGLKINGSISLLNSSTNSTRLWINLVGASIRWSLSNPNNHNNIYYDNSSNLTSVSFPQLFGWKSRNIFSNYYEINITYNIPEIKVYNLDVYGSNVKGSPVTTPNNWVNLNTKRLTRDSGFSVSGLRVLRTKDYVSTSFISYAVIMPPQLRVRYNESINTTSFPFNQNTANRGSYYISLVNPTQTSYSIKNNKFTLINNNIGYLQNYSNMNDEEIVIFGNYMKIYYYYDVSANESNNIPMLVYSGTIDKLKDVDNDKLRVSTQNNSSVYDILYRQFIATSDPLVNGNQVYNIRFTISDAFIGPPPSSIYFNLLTSKSSVVGFYQSNIKLIDTSFVLIIDKYECNRINYDDIINNPGFNKLIFTVSSHYTSSFEIDGKQLSLSDFPVNMKLLFDEIDKDKVRFIKDEEFVSRNVGIALSALATPSIANLKNLVRHNSNLMSSVYYVNAPDAINVKSLFGPSVFRVTHSGNVKTPAVTSNLYNIIDTVP